VNRYENAGKHLEFVIHIFKTFFFLILSLQDLHVYGVYSCIVLTQMISVGY